VSKLTESQRALEQQRCYSIQTAGAKTTEMSVKSEEVQNNSSD